MKNKRSWIVIIASIVYYLIILTTLYYAISGNMSNWIGKELPVWYNYFIYVTAILYTIAFIFILKMKKIALIAITIITVIGHFFSFFIDVFNFGSLIIDIIIFGTLWTQVKKMN